MNLFSSFFVALLVSMLLVPLLMRYAAALKLTDVPDARKVHDEVVPRSGGLAIVAGFAASIILYWPSDPLLAAIIAGAGIIALFGYLDDRNDLSYKWKFLGQIIAAILVVAAGLHIEIWPFFGVEPVTPWLSWPVTVLFLVGVTNAMNLSDGLDGLAAGTSLITLSAVAWLFWESGNAVQVTLTLAVIGSICGFLRYNNHPALVFMGDTGSQFLGFVSACLVVMLCQKTNVALNPGLLILLVGLPVLDTIAVMTWRIRTGRSPFLPDKNHFHQRLLDFGLRHYEAVSLIYFAQALMVSLAVLIRYQSDVIVIGIYVVLAALILLFFRWARSSEWQFRDVSAQGAHIERRNEWLRNVPGLPKFLERLTELLASGFLIVGAIYSKTVAEQIGWIAAAGALVALCAGMVPRSWRNNVLRLIVFAAGVLAVYVMSGEPRFSFTRDWHINAYMILLAGVLIFAIRMTRREFFRTSPLDVLIVFFVLAVVIATSLAGRTGQVTLLADTAIRLAVFFYVGEYLSSRQRDSFRVLPMAAMASLTILAARGLMSA